MAYSDKTNKSIADREDLDKLRQEEINSKVESSNKSAASIVKNDEAIKEKNIPDSIKNNKKYNDYLKLQYDANQAANDAAKSYKEADDLRNAALEDGKLSKKEKAEIEKARDNAKKNVEKLDDNESKLRALDEDIAEDLDILNNIETKKAGQPAIIAANIENATDGYINQFASSFLKENPKHYRNMIISAIDFIGNDFDVIFELDTTDSSGIDATIDSMYEAEKNNNVLRKIVEKKSEKNDTRDEVLRNLMYISARCQSVNIPMPKANSHQFKIGLNTVQKVSSSFTMSNQSSISIRMDKDFYIYDIFNIIAGNEDLQEVKNTGDKENPKKEYYSKIHPQIAMTALSKKPKVNIYVRRRNLLENVTENIYSDGIIDTFKNLDFRYVDVHKRVNQKLREETQFSSLIPTAEDTVLANLRTKIHNNDTKPYRGLTKLGTMQLPYFIFQDVKFVGFGNALDLDRDGGGPQIIPLEFIFKKLIMSPMKDPGKKDELYISSQGSNPSSAGGNSSGETGGNDKKTRKPFSFSSLLPDAAQQRIAAATKSNLNFASQSPSGNIQKLQNALNIGAGIDGVVGEFTEAIGGLKDKTEQMVEDIKHEGEEIKTTAQKSKESMLKYFQQGGITGVATVNGVSGNANDALNDIIEDIEKETK